MKKSNTIILLFMLLCLIVTACGGSNKRISSSRKTTIYKKLSKDDPRNTKYRGHYKVGNKYKIKNRTYRPREVKRLKQVGIASWYGSRYGFHGNKTANGDLYNKNMLTAAHRTLQLPSIVKVTNLENKKSVIVLVNDRGPYAKRRIIDLSERAAEIIDMKRKGTAKVKIQYLHKESQAFLKKMGINRSHGSRAKSHLANKKCTVNCQIKLINLRHKIKVR